VGVIVCGGHAALTGTSARPRRDGLAAPATGTSTRSRGLRRVAGPGPVRAAAEPYGFQHLSGDRVDSISRNLSDVRVEPFEPSPYVEPQTVRFNLKGAERSWAMIRSMNSVAVVLYHRELDSAVMVRQFRPPVWASAVASEAAAGSDASLAQGFTFELCAGLMDKPGLSPEEVAREEILEECGYEVPLDGIEKVATYNHAMAHLGTKEHIFYAEVRTRLADGFPSDGLQISGLPFAFANLAIFASCAFSFAFAQVEEGQRQMGGGGGLAEDGEAIEVLALPIGECRRFILDDAFPKSAAAIIGIQWLLAKQGK